MQRTAFFFITSGFLVIMMLVVGCARSQKYQEEEAEGPQEYPSSYYARGGQPLSPTKRIAQMGQPRKRVLILNFWNDTPIQDETLGKFASEELKRELHLTKRVLIPQEVTTRFETSDFVDGPQVKVAQLIREGRRHGVAVIVIGRIAKIIFRQRGDDVGLFRQAQSMAAVDVEMKIFDIHGGREIAAVGTSGEASSSSTVALDSGNLESKKFRRELIQLALRQAMGRVKGKLVRQVEKMGWQGKIAKVTPGKIFINAGKNSGLVAGDILKVLTQGDDIYDPDTGAFLGKTPGRLKGTLEVVDFIGKDGSSTVVHSGGNFKSGDIVKLY